MADTCVYSDSDSNSYYDDALSDNEQQTSKQAISQVRDALDAVSSTDEHDQVHMTDDGCFTSSDDDDAPGDNEQQTSKQANSQVRDDPVANPSNGLEPTTENEVFFNDEDGVHPITDDFVGCFDENCDGNKFDACNKEIDEVIEQIKANSATTKRLHQRQSAINKKKQEKGGGYSLMRKKDLRSIGVQVATGGNDDAKRTCLPDALWTILKSLRPACRITKESTRKYFEEYTNKENIDPTQDRAEKYMASNGVLLIHQSKMTFSPQTVLRQGNGIFLVRLYWSDPNGQEDMHCVVYNADRKIIIDNVPYTKMPLIEASDTKDNYSAIKCFAYFFNPGAKIRIVSVYKAELVAREDNGMRNHMPRATRDTRICYSEDSEDLTVH